MPISNPIINISINNGGGTAITVADENPTTQGGDTGDAVFNSSTGGLFIADDNLDYLPVFDTRSRLITGIELVSDNATLTGIPLHVYGVASDERVTPDNMTDNITPYPYVASSSGVYASDEYLAFDGSIYQTNGSAACWLDLSNGLPVWLAIDLGDIYQVAAYSIASFADFNNTPLECSCPKSWQLQYSHDEITWDVADGITDFTDWNSYDDFSHQFGLSSAVSARYWRLYITDEVDPDSTNDVITISNFELIGLNPDATSNRLMQGVDFNISLFDGVYTLSILNSSYTQVKVEYLVEG